MLSDVSKLSALQRRICEDIPDPADRDSFLFGMLLSSLKQQGCSWESIKASLVQGVEELKLNLNRGIVKPEIVVVGKDGRPVS